MHVVRDSKVVAVDSRQRVGAVDSTQSPAVSRFFTPFQTRGASLFVMIPLERWNVERKTSDMAHPCVCDADRVLYPVGLPLLRPSWNGAT